MPENYNSFVQASSVQEKHVDQLLNYIIEEYSREVSSEEETQHGSDKITDIGKPKGKPITATWGVSQIFL